MIEVFFSDIDDDFEVYCLNLICFCWKGGLGLDGKDGNLGFLGVRVRFVFDNFWYYYFFIVLLRDCLVSNVLFVFFKIINYSRVL